ncbi:MAG: hypothetical protein E5X19_05730 [Mesorhizobium sp.]|nr:MAG: hypothetical protein E5X19_05730 [Mesorhizobium sp.]
MRAKEHSPMSLFSAIAPEVQRLKAAFAGKAASDAQTQQLEAELASTKAELSLAQASLATAEATEADLTAKLKAANDALAAAVPQAAEPAPAA